MAGSRPSVKLNSRRAKSLFFLSWSAKPFSRERVSKHWGIPCGSAAFAAVANQEIWRANGNRQEGIRHLIRRTFALPEWFSFRPRNAKRFRVEFLQVEGDMTSTKKTRSRILALGMVLGFSSLAHAQQTSQPDVQQLRSYNLSREVFLLGTVVKFESASSAFPMGAHVVLQTSSGQVDVHLGNAKVLQAGHLDLNPGDNVRIVGEPLALGDSTYFAARIVQKGAQAVAVRNTRGFLTTAASLMTPAQKEALRGVR
jgi:hypothetical protein